MVVASEVNEAFDRLFKRFLAEEAWKEQIMNGWLAGKAVGA